ncbi:MAG: TonB-dependent receptor [Bacteroidetes bacterium]|nr:TonB-dependent receptor [Bacteroidota bacterium]MDA0860708.1 TonB-dependent receptor [Bacteroidota bacterium]MDA1319239.1 TonB-dependent receptor [Bacteroidota bacterium]
MNSQTGKITGTVIDGEFNEPMAFANVLIKNTTKGTTSDFDGKYTIDVEPGNYTVVFSYIGYQTIEISDVAVEANEDVIVDVTLNTNSLETVVITTTVRKNTESAVLDLQKNSITLLDGLSAQGIKSSGASNIANAVKNVPGVSIQGGKYVYVRGLGDRYTKSILNGVDIPGLDPDRNTVQMDIFPTSILDNIIVVKSAAAEYPADFTGGVINVVTKDFPTKATYSISVGASYNPNMHFKDNYLSYTGSKTDVLGFDNGMRDLPVGRNQSIPGTFDNSSVLTDMTSAFNKELTAKQNNSGANFDFGFTAGNQYDVGDNKLGYQFSLSYKNNTQFYDDRVDGTYIRDENNSSINELLGTRRSNGIEGKNNVLLSTLAGIVYKRELAKYKFNVLHIQNGESTAGIYNQEIAQAGGGSGFEPIKKDALLYTQRSITNILFGGQHSFSDGDWKLNWKLSPTLSRVYDKDHRITPLQQSDDGAYFISPSAASYPIRIWRNLEELNVVGKLDVVRKYSIKERPSKLKFGLSQTFKQRDFSIDDYTFTRQGGLQVENGNADNLLANGNIWTPQSDQGTHLVFGDLFEKSNAFDAIQNISAAYVSNEFEVTEKLKAVVGLRTELFTSIYTGQNQAGTEVFKDEKIIDKIDLFPSANLIYGLNENTNLRVSYSRTTARPSFKEASKSQIFDPITNRLFIGNIDLDPSYINNFDVRAEFFGENSEMIAFSAFIKEFNDPIELTFYESAPDQLTPRNLGDASVFGLEFEFRKSLGFISNGLEKLKINVNASYIESSLTMFEDEYTRRVNAARDGEVVENERELQGQSPYLINAGLNYNDTEIGLQTGLFFNVQGKTLEVVGTGIVPDVYTVPFNSLNFTLNKKIGAEKKSTIEIKISNILDSQRKSVYESFNAAEQVFTQLNPGTEFSIGYSYSF